MMKLCLRNEFAQHALLPLAATLPKIDDLQHFRSVAKKLAFLSTFDSEKRTRWVTRSNVCQCLGISNTHFSVVVDILEYMTASSPSSPASSDRADLFALIAALFAHVYWRQAQKVDTMDVWQPSNLSDASAAATSEPVTSPRSARRQALGAGNGHAKPPRQIAAHVLGQHAKLERMLVEFVVRHAEELLHLLADDVVSQAATASASNSRITAHEFDRLGLLLQPDAVSTSEPGYAVAAKCLPISPATGLFEGSAMPTIQELVVWMAAGNVRESNIAAVIEGSAPSSPVLQAGLQGAGAAPSAPGTQPVLPQVDLQDCTDILALNHSTMVKSALDVPSGRARVVGCHDSVVYLLAPLAHLTVSDCTDCTVVLGPVGVTLCIEHCDRMQVMAPSARITVHSCHDCVLHLATNRAPLCIGDNRCVQLAPYNTQYAALRKHLQDVGVRTDLNLWNMFIEIGKEARRAHHERSSSTSPHKPDLHESAPPVSTMPPSELLPFLIPFQGDSAPLCGGPPRRSRSSKSMASSSATSSTADRSDLASSLSSSVVPRSVIIPDLFQLPPEYEAALGHKVQAVTGIRTAIKKAVLEEPRKAELQAVIQAHFKDWLVQSGLMRQVYDLARMERSSAAGEAQASSATNGSPNATRGSG